MGSWTSKPSGNCGFETFGFWSHSLSTTIKDPYKSYGRSKWVSIKDYLTINHWFVHSICGLMKYKSYKSNYPKVSCTYRIKVKES